MVRRAGPPRFAKKMFDVMHIYVYTCTIMSADKSAPPKYRDQRTELFAKGERVREFHAIKDQAERRLDILETAVDKNDLRKLPSNRFEALGGDRKGQFSIRINAQWRICFELPDDHEKPYNIHIIDYH